jgi:hypothetical protein
MYDHDDVDIRRELREARHEPAEEFVAMLASRVQAPEPRRRAAPRVALAFAMTLAALAVAAAFGGVSQAAFAVESAVSSVVNVGHKTRPHQAGTAAGATVSTSSANGSHAQLSGGPSRGGSHQPPPVVKPSKSPSGDQYNPGCTQGYRGRYIACHAP